MSLQEAADKEWAKGGKAAYGVDVHQDLVQAMDPEGEVASKLTQEKQELLKELKSIKETEVKVESSSFTCVSFAFKVDFCVSYHYRIVRIINPWAISLTSALNRVGL